MRYVMTFAGRRFGRLLESGVSRGSTADECREAALGFMAGAAAGWDKLDVALWLTGPYARASRHARAGERVPAPSASRHVSSETLGELVDRVRVQMLASLERAALEGGALDFVQKTTTRGHVARRIAESGDDVWVPVDLV